MRSTYSTLISSYPQRHWYQGDYSELDPETGLQAFDLRMYSSRIGRWLSVDPYAQYWSPYLAMGNNPVSRVDPDGGFAICPTCPGGSLFDVYRNSPHYFYYDQGIISNFDPVVITPQPTSTFVLNTKIASEIGGGIYGGLRATVTPGSKWLGKNGKYYDNSWGGNQHTGSRSGAFKAANAYKWAGRATVGVSALVGVVETYNGIQVDGGKFGYNAQSAALEATGSLLGGWAGAKSGAALGLAFGAWFGPPGLIVGPIVGTVIGGFGGGYYGGQLGNGAVNLYHNK